MMENSETTLGLNAINLDNNKDQIRGLVSEKDNTDESTTKSNV